MDNGSKTIERKVAETILQRGEEVTVGGRTYTAAPASTATLILASEAISRLPQAALDPERVVEESLAVAKDCRALGEVAAILVLGAKGLTATERTRREVVRRRLWGLVRRTEWVEEERTVDRKAELARELLEELSPHELYLLVARLLGRLEVGDFFGLTTFLTGTNMLRRRKVETGTTASGR